MIIGDTDGFVKLVFRPGNQELLGASIVGENASELIHVAMAVIANGGTIDFFIQSVFNYPSLADAYKYAAYDGLQALARRYARTPGLRPSGEQRAVTA
jgi:NAD(P) transhydrogenase